MSTPDESLSLIENKSQSIRTRRNGKSIHSFFRPVELFRLSENDYSGAVEHDRIIVIAAWQNSQ